MLMSSPPSPANDSFYAATYAQDGMQMAPLEDHEQQEQPVMLIDDSEIVRKIIEVSFQRIGIPVSIFPDGITAIRALAQHQVTVPRLLLLDIGLPRMNGYEVASILRSKKEFEQTIIVMLSGHDGMVDRLRSRLIGARDFIAKPFRVSQVVNTVCSYLEIDPGLPDPENS
ncbi:MAG TPA: response regulator [Ktedonobacterales bacterium]|jgi:twitching motility two-component system response regulator PilG